MAPGLLEGVSTPQNRRTSGPIRADGTVDYAVELVDPLGDQALTGNFY